MERSFRRAIRRLHECRSAATPVRRVRDEKLKVLQSLRPLVGPDVVRDTVRGQYTEGLVEGRRCPRLRDRARRVARRDPAGRDPSDTETCVALRAEVANRRWVGVPGSPATTGTLVG